MFPYDSVLTAALHNSPQSVADVLRIMQTIQNTCTDVDGLKWFNGLYLNVTEAVEDRINAGGFKDSTWLALLDVEFASLYFAALAASLEESPTAGCWQCMFCLRNNPDIARIQFALAGMNAHINHDLCQAIVTTCKASNLVPQHGTAQYEDYTSLNATLDSLIDSAKRTLHVRLRGAPLPEVSHLEDVIAAWNIAAARETAWNNAQSLWNLPSLLAKGLIDGIDGFTTVIGKSLLIPVPYVL